MPLRAPLIALGCALALAACGGAGPEDDVRAALERFGDATSEKDYTTMCDELFATTFVEQIASTGQPCETVLQAGLGDVQMPTLQVSEVEVNDDEALATVRTGAQNQRPSEDQVRLVRQDGDWRIASLASPQPQPPPATQP